VGAGYQVSEKLTITGEIMYGQNPFMYGNSPMQQNPQIIYSAGAEYKVNDNFKIGIEVSNGKNSPFGNESMNNSFNPHGGF